MFLQLCDSYSIVVKEPIDYKVNKIICRGKFLLQFTLIITNEYKVIIIKKVFKVNCIFNQIMMNIQQGYYKYIGSGSSRQVFDLRNGYVIKVAINSAGILQNQSEYRISCKDKSGLFAKVVRVSNDFRILIMEKAEKIYNISRVYEYFNVKSKEELFNLEELKNIFKENNLLTGDLNRESNWGVINGRPVIIDYGFTREVCRRYYFFF